jgi:hypothetical protein
VASHDPWIEVAKLFGELLSPNRCVLLRTLEGQMYVRETQWIGCSKGEIDERRRDFRRHPYKKAVDEGQPVLIAEEWLFFKKVDDQLQYLAPLKFRGKLLGFAAVAVSASVVEQDAGYVLGLQRVADQAAEMLQRRRDLGVGAQLLSRDTDQANLKSWGDLIDAAALSARALRGKLTRLEAVIAASPQAGLLFDLYGNLLLADASMQELLAEEGIVVAGDSALSIVAELCSVPVSRIRQTVRELAVRREPHIRTISLPRSGDPYFLHLTPVATNTVGRGIDDVYPFQVMCVRLDLLPAVGLGTLDWLAGAEDVPRSPTTREVS